MLALLIVMGAEIVLSTRQLSQTFDESDHLYSGYEYWKHADFGHNPEHPPLAKLVAGLALLPLHLQEPGAIPGRSFKVQDFIAAQKFLYTADADQLLARARFMMLIFTLGLGLVLFSAGREMFGSDPALLALALFVFEPMLLAHGGLVTTDMALSCTLFCSVYAFYRYSTRPSAARLAICAIAVGLTLVAKQSGVFVFPILAVLALGDLLLKLHRPGNTARRNLIAGAAISFALAFIVIAAVSYTVLWAFYGFRYAARPSGLAMAPSLDVYGAAIPNHLEAAVIAFCARHHLLPEAYLFGWADILQLPGARITFLIGKLYLGRKWFLFPVLILMKTTVGLLALFALVPFAALWRRGREFLYLAAPAAIYLLIAIGSGMNGEARYILPIYPFCIVLAAAAAFEFARRSRAWTIAVAALVLFAAASSLHAFPNYLPYANEAFGGPSRSYLRMSDSNGDWVQGLKFTRTYLDRNHISDCWIDYSDPAIDPAYYGIPCRPLTSAWIHRGVPTPTGVPETISGTIVLSATELDGNLWGPGALNPYDQFKRVQPDATPGDVILIYHGTFHLPLASAYSRISAANALLRSNKMTDAVAQAQAAAQLAPDSADIQAALGNVLHAAGRNTEAERANARALHLAQTVYPEFQQPLIHQLQGSGITYRP